MKLLGNNILVEPLPQSSRTLSGLHLVERYPENQMYYTVIAVGPGRRTRKGVVIPPEVKPGDRIIAHSFEGDKAVMDKQKIINAEKIMAVLCP